MASPPLPPGFSSIPVAGLKWKAAPMPSWAATALPGLPAGAAASGARVDCAPGVLGPHERRMDGDPGMAGGTRGGDRGRRRGRGMRRGRLVLGSLLRAGGRGRRWRLGRIGSGLLHRLV